MEQAKNLDLTNEKLWCCNLLILKDYYEEKKK
jgi:hypothetical protein